MTVVGQGRYAYRVVPGWGDLPADWGVGDVAGVAVDGDEIFVFSRSTHPMAVLNADGGLLRTWGEGEFTHPHSVTVAPDRTLWCTDDGSHRVSHYTRDGQLLGHVGPVDGPSPFHSGRPFHRCTHTAVGPDGAVYVTDGYGNARVHKYAPDGELVLSWGTAGMGPGEFNLPHNIVCDPDGWVYVADRENHRIQVFDGDGRFETMWGNLHRPSSLYRTPGPDPVFLVGELGPVMRFSRGAPNLGPRLSVLSDTGELLARIGTDTAGVGPGQFLSPHAMACDSRGDLYVAEVGETAWPQLFPGEPLPQPLRCLQKLERIGA
ncbi:NHL repeat-containing protein [Streptomyces sp. DvalAA-14]|uniref:peptidyl-alpha-hydroxyglycine alpha-amidating lyase family protein n=1 Tax=unclassified Streptomyces TaxID=2593676 RepID=UPI00081B630D|nr:MULTISPECIES: peptidyl-alpha-hydroxyglycine alpha-amidating lyase family protein [unclassified Streptomyces]MYS21820.1 hypothetical protein [Streptomyces sp. SID4948]SCE01809.1 NHL repeat-containing protein [Streptomyces sp. DvalAA-14]